jgi:hypothetical protein
MSIRRPRVPIGLLIAIPVLIILGIVSGPLIRATVSEEQLARNILLGGIPFILIFVAIVLVFITLISATASMLNNNVSPKVHRIIEVIFIFGIVAGMIGMFQPWLFSAFKYSFMTLLFSTLGFILWSHILPKHVHFQEEIGPTRIGGIIHSESEIEKEAGQAP